MVQTIAPRDSGGLTRIDAEPRHIEPATGESDIHFDVQPSGGMPDGIPVEPSTLLFEPTDGGFGNIFGEAPPADELDLDLVPVTQNGFGAPADLNADSRTPLHVRPSAPTDPGKARPSSQELFDGAVSAVQPAGILPAPPSGGAATGNGQRAEAEGEGTLRSATRRFEPRNSDAALTDFGQPPRPRVASSGEADISFTDLAEATGIRRNTGPVGAASVAAHSSAAIPHNESPNKQPVIDSGGSNLWSRLRWPIAVISLLCMLAAVGYFLGLQKWINAEKPAARQSVNVDPGSASPQVSKPIDQPAETAAQPAEKPAEVPADAAPPAIKDPEPSPSAVVPPTAGEPQPTHSLQAASVPNEAGAKEFAEKLIRAGVPSYVVAADIPRRGKWFRVRVGRFASAEEATKYSVQARQRAKAAGINLTLMVCDYEAP